MSTQWPDAAGAPAPALSSVVRAGDVASTLIEALAVALLSASALVALLQVFCRYVLDNSLSWPEELAQWMFIWAVFLGTATLVAGKGHIAIETFSPQLSLRARAL